MTWNPIWGCLNNCEYCYARGIAKRFYRQIYELEVKHHFERHPTWVWTGDHLEGLRDFKPTFLYSQYCKKFPKKPQRIFVGSMSEIYYWDEEWIEMVIEKVKKSTAYFPIFDEIPGGLRQIHFSKKLLVGSNYNKRKRL